MTLIDASGQLPQIMGLSVILVFIGARTLNLLFLSSTSDTYTKPITLASLTVSCESEVAAYITASMQCSIPGFGSTCSYEPFASSSIPPGKNDNAFAVKWLA